MLSKKMSPIFFFTAGIFNRPESERAQNYEYMNISGFDCVHFIKPSQLKD